MKRFLINICVGFAVLLLLNNLQSCKQEEIGENPYAGGEAPLGVKFEKLNRKLDKVRPNDVFEVLVRGLKQHADKVKAYINEESAEVVAVTDSTISIRVPALVSSGGLKLMIDNQVYYGPRVPIEGNVSVDTDIKFVNGFDGMVNQIMPNGSNFWVTGYFNDFENQATNVKFINSIHSINSLGESVENSFGIGAIGGINAITKMTDGMYVVGGNLFSYYKRPVTNITKIMSNGALDTMIVDVINTTPENPKNSKDTVPTFNALLNGQVSNVFSLANNEVIAVGSFTSYAKIDYTFSSRTQRFYHVTQVRDIIKLKSNGTMDSTFMIGNSGSNGIVLKSIRLNDGRIVLAGLFTTFNGQPANRIVCIKPDGTIDKSFTAAGGANDVIVSITYNATRNKIAIAGRFSTYGGQAVNGVAILNADGSVDQTFKMRDIDKEIPTYAYIMNNGRVLVSGSFRKYDNVNRSGLLILESDGSLLQKYNNIGNFNGMINTIVETTSSLGNPALFIGGSISSVDGEKVGNILRLEVKN